MSTASAFLEVVWTGLAVGCPLGLFGVVAWIQIDLIRSRRRQRLDRGIAATAWTGNPAYLLVAMVGAASEAGARLVQVILGLLLIITILVATMPYGRGHGWW